MYYNGHTYLIYGPSSWSDARQDAEVAGGHLATVTTAAENAAVYQLAAAEVNLANSVALDGGGASYVWLGASDAVTEGNWLWGDGSVVGAYKNWGKGGLGAEPDNYGLVQDAMAMGLSVWPFPSGGIGVAGKWNDIDAVNQIYSVVEWDFLLGTDSDELITGTAGNDRIEGLAGNDTLNGAAGADVLIGGEGDDTYLIDNAGDSVVDRGGDISDGIRASISIDLERFQLGRLQYEGVENVVLTGTAALNATGDAGGNILTGNDGANVLNGGAGADVMLGGKGGDTYIVDDFGDSVQEDSAVVGEIDLIKSSVDFALVANVENLMLTGTDNLMGLGNALANTILGNDGDNELDGLGGLDVLKGGKGSDKYIVDLIKVGTGVSATARLQDTVIEMANEGALDELVLRTPLGGVLMAQDLGLVKAATITLGANFESMTAEDTGANKLNLTGNALANRIVGNASDNILDGGLGVDTLIGGEGDDTYIIETSDETITEFALGGSDTVKIKAASTGSYALAANLENASLLNTVAYTLIGNAERNVLTGNTAANTLDSGSGDDTLDGGGGADILIGGSGNDTYVVDNVGDSVSDSGGDLADTIRASINIDLNLAKYSGVENVLLVGALALSASGNDARNILTGNGAANVLDGGAEADGMDGGKGNDTYVVDNIGDSISDVAGVDLVKSSIDYELTDVALENLTLVGNANLSGTGNILANIIVGNAGNNVLDGLGGVDTLKGGKGDDKYIVDLIKVGTGASAVAKLQDVVVELGNEGSADELVLSTLVDLGGGNIQALDLGLQKASTIILGANFEKMTAEDTGSNLLNLTGNALGNEIIGNDAANLLNGGLGNDVLAGGAGADTFRFDSALSVTNVDHITDFVSGLDKISLSRTIFSRVSGVSDFASDATDLANNVAQHLLYNSSTGSLYYNADGSGVGVPSLIAVLDNHAMLTSADFVIV